MSRYELLNPVWYSMTSAHKDLVVGNKIKRYQPEVAPNAACESTNDCLTSVEAAIGAFDQPFCFLGIAPKFDDHWNFERKVKAVQMVNEKPKQTSATQVKVRKLVSKDWDIMFDLAQLVFPSYYRRNSPQLGDFFGVFKDSRLVSMCGLRFSTPSYSEITTVCTHPDWAGQGLGTVVYTHMVHHIREQGKIPFLHMVSPDKRLIQFYEKSGFKISNELDLSFFSKKV